MRQLLQAKTHCPYIVMKNQMSLKITNELKMYLGLVLAYYLKGENKSKFTPWSPKSQSFGETLRNRGKRY